MKHCAFLVPLLSAVVLGIGLMGCSGQEGSPATPEFAVLHAQSDPGLLSRMQAAPSQTRFSGQRQLWIRSGAGSGARVLAYDETVYADGLGGFAIEPGAVSQPNLTTGQSDLFEILQRTREGFLFRYRDFAIRDVDLLAQNYLIQDTGVTVTVVGRLCTELRFDRVLAPRRSYVVAVDKSTSLVLRCEELNPAGLVVMRMEHTSFDPAPTLAGITMHVDLPAVQLNPAQDNRPTLGFPLRLPQVLHGFQLVTAEQITYDGRKWARAHYQDGVEPLLFLYSSRTATPGGSLPISGDGMNSAPVVRVFEAGEWTIAHCKYLGSEFIVAGKLDESRLLETLRSAL